jgi:hypothetical protein
MELVPSLLAGDLRLLPLLAMVLSRAPAPSHLLLHLPLPSRCPGSVAARPGIRSPLRALSPAYLSSHSAPGHGAHPGLMLPHDVLGCVAV